MSEIIRVKVRRGKHHRHSSHHKRAKSLASSSKKFQTRFPRIYRVFKNTLNFFKKHRFFGLLTILNLAGLLLNAIFFLFEDFAADYTATFGHFLRLCLGTLSSFFPFSLGEFLVLSFLAFMLIWVFVLYFALKRKYTLRRIHHKMRNTLLAPLAAALIVLSLFLFTFSSAYHTPPLAQKLGLNESDIYDRDLYNTVEYLVQEINTTLSKIETDDAGSTVMPYNFNNLSSEINLSFQDLNDEEQICPATGSPAKSFVTSPILTKFSLAGVYTFFSGEANINTAYPDFCLPYYTAHELAHQRGIASENDANFTAFLVCAASTDPYIRYSGHLNALMVLKTELAQFLAIHEAQDPDYTTEIRDNVNNILAKLDERVNAELRAYHAFYNEHKNDSLTKLSSDLNDTYLKTQGQTAGEDSYQYLTALIVNYYTTYLA